MTRTQTKRRLATAVAAILADPPVLTGRTPAVAAAGTRTTTVTFTDPTSARIVARVVVDQEPAAH